MKHLIILTLILISLTTNAQEIRDLSAFNNKLFVATDIGVYVMSDNSRYLIKLPEMRNIPVSKISVKGSVIFVYQSDYSVYVSRDTGKTWSFIYTYSDQVIIKSFTSYNEKLYGVKGKNYYESTDFGKTWQKTKYPDYDTKNSLWTRDINVISDDYYFRSSITSSASIGDNVCATTDIGLYVSYDNGKYWHITDFSKGKEGQNVVVLDSIFYALIDHKIYKSTKHAINWIPCRNTNEEIAEDAMIKSTINPWWEISNLKKNMICYTKTSKGYIAGTYNGLIYKDYNSTDWTEIAGISSLTQVYELANNGKTIFAASNNGIFISNDEGKNWIASNEGIDFVSNKYSIVHENEKTVASVLVYGNLVFASNINGIFVSDNNGQSWKKHTTINLPETEVCDLYFYNGTFTQELKMVCIHQLMVE